MNACGPKIVVEFDELPPREQLESEWRELEARGNPSFFTSWSWIGCWLACLPARVRPRLLRATHGVKIMGLGIVVPRIHLRHKLLPVKGLYLHATGDPLFDEVTIEYNGFLVDRTLKAAIVARFLEFLVWQVEAWDELHLDGVTEFVASSLAGRQSLRIRRQRASCRYVDLEKVRAAGCTYLSLLGHGTRYNIRRSIKEFEKQGPITLTTARSRAEAMEYLSGLKALHQEYWRSRGLPGAFGESTFQLFHEELINSRFDSGEIQLIRTSTGDRAIGYLYNFVHHGLVHNYQTGFDYSICKRQYSPGLVTHSLAIEYNLDQGQLVYDLMAGDSQYKQALGTASNEIEWIVIQRDLFKYRLEDGLRKIKHRLRPQKQAPRV